MELTLQACPNVAGRRVEVINFGVSRFSTGREQIMLRKRVWQYSPDVILLLFTTGNDVKENSRALYKEYVGPALPYFVYRNGELILDDSLLKVRDRSLKFPLQQSFLGGFVNWGRNHLRLFGFVDKVIFAYQTTRPQ